jgi:hypothetical protein
MANHKPVDNARKLFGVLYHVRARPYYAHISKQNVYELGRFVNVCHTQYMPPARSAAIILCSLKAVGIFVLPHCTELVATENPAFQTGSLLNEERISRHCAFGYDNYNYQYHRKQGT